MYRPFDPNVDRGRALFQIVDDLAPGLPYVTKVKPVLITFGEAAKTPYFFLVDIRTEDQKDERKWQSA